MLDASIICECAARSYNTNPFYYKQVINYCSFGMSLKLILLPLINVNAIATGLAFAFLYPHQMQT